MFRGGNKSSGKYEIKILSTVYDIGAEMSIVERIIFLRRNIVGANVWHYSNNSNDRFFGYTNSIRCLRLTYEKYALRRNEID